MKTKLLFAFVCMMMAGTVYLHAQQLWAVTPEGGAYGSGAIIRMNPDGSGFQVEHSYQCSVTAGCQPMGNLMQASNGQLYGTCFLGGFYASCTIDRYDPVTGTYYNIHDFNVGMGDFPRSGLVEANNGKLYGAASSGGPPPSWNGLLYSIDMTTNVYTVEHYFSVTDGFAPWGCPILKNGILYGLTTGGGAFSDGVLYSYNIASSTYTALYNFDEATGNVPKGSLYEAANGIFYGLTSEGGANGHGVIFSYNPATNSLNLLHSFYGTDGSAPEGTLMQAADGKLYGVTTNGGVNNIGVLFSYDITANVCTKLYDFVVATGSNPLGNLYQSSDQKLYGTVSNGGANNLGVLFSYDLSTSTYTDILDFNGTNGSHPTGGFIMVDLTTGITPLTADAFSVSPNPASEEINITVRKESHYHIQLFNVTGEILFSAESYSAQSNIDVSHLPKGIYFVEVKAANGKTVNKKIVKM
jgi:uncharacterized repeat protein (TIGR03803 family)